MPGLNHATQDSTGSKKLSEPEAVATPCVLQPQRTDETVRSVRFNPTEAIPQRQPSLEAAHSASAPLSYSPKKPTKL